MSRRGGGYRDTRDGVAWYPPKDDAEAAAAQRRAASRRILAEQARRNPAPNRADETRAAVPACNVCHGPGCAVCDPEGHPPARVADALDEAAERRHVDRPEPEPEALPLFPSRGRP